MREALSQAASDPNEVPVGAVIIDLDGRIVARSSNKNRSLNDPTAHAEILAIRELCNTLGTSCLEGYSIYVTLEPCPMCATAISYSKIDSLFYGARDIKFGAIESNYNIFQSDMSLHKPNIYSGICERECADLLKNFFLNKRNLACSASNKP